ncbi:hypothetical protein GCM10022276_13200 [Sphingomonas limnosediminicola]|uniref:HTH cro/C1-type domain-containing protein n=1 Tax=Sphingomonas limnosediminicola TaxID=940133 RepID=A0ABP7L5S3_9SPHN
MRGRKPNTPAEATIAGLEDLMTRCAWSQSDLARKLCISTSTVSRALSARTASAAFLARANKVVEEGQSIGRGGGPSDARELHLLQEMYGLLKKVSGRIEELAAESRFSRERERHR